MEHEFPTKKLWILCLVIEEILLILYLNRNKQSGSYMILHNGNFPHEWQKAMAYFVLQEQHFNHHLPILNLKIKFTSLDINLKLTSLYCKLARNN